MKTKKSQKEKPYNPLILAKTISFRVTEFELQKVNKLFENTNLTRSDFMRNVIAKLQTENNLLTSKN